MRITALLLVLPLLACGDNDNGSPTGSPTGDPTNNPTTDNATSDTPSTTTGDPSGPTSVATTTPTSDGPGSATDTGPDTTATTATTADPGTTGTTGEPGETTLGELLSADLFAQMFPQRNALYSHEALLAAAAWYPAFASDGGLDDRRRELAAFLANIGHETTGGWPDAPGGPYAWGLYFTQEVGCENNSCTGYCDPNNVQYPCAPGKTYHGRGPIQLSWNYNYGQAGDAIGEPLLTDPDLVTSDGAIAFRTALWFWMTAQAPKPSAHDVMVGAWQPSADDQAKGRVPGFGMTINIINGGLECGQPTGAKVEDRVGFYQRFTDMLMVDPGAALYCDGMQPY